jgi:hypothetical protein
VEPVVHQNPASGVKQFMRSETVDHVPPIRLWQALCGGAELPKRQYQHIIHCVACETLATQIGDALDDIEDALRRNNIGMGGAQGSQRLN